MKEKEYVKKHKNKKERDGRERENKFIQKRKCQSEGQRKEDRK